MRPAPQARHFEPIEHNYFVKWFKKKVLSVEALSSKFKDFEIFV
jgi:hypothetical protein